MKPCIRCGAPTRNWDQVKHCSRECASETKRLRTPARFWSKVRKSDGCWEWAAGLMPFGYGDFSMTLPGGVRRPVLAHRYSWEQTYGPIAAGLFVLHRCDNRKCVRPDHLFLGDHQANMDDMWAKGRANPGRAAVREQHLRRLTAADAERMRERWNAGATRRQLGAEFGVSKAHVGRIVHGRSWRAA